MKSLADIASEWGAEGFEKVPTALVCDPCIPTEIKDALVNIGLPVQPAESLRLNLRFENIDIKHIPASVRFLRSDDFETGSRFPESGDPLFDQSASLKDFLLIGECPNDFPKSGFLTRYICIDVAHGDVYWVYPKLFKGSISIARINTGLHSYLASLLAYKTFRDEFSEVTGLYDAENMSEEYLNSARPIHTVFLADLEAADPNGFKGGFWEEHAWNEAILMEI